MKSPEKKGSRGGSVVENYHKLASISTFIIMLIAIAATKVEVLANVGFWEMMHGSRSHWAMLPGNLFLIIKEGGEFSVDGFIINKKNAKSG